MNPSSDYLLRVADILYNGAHADIWYHASDHDDEQADNTIGATQHAMVEAAHILRTLTTTTRED